MSEQPHVPVVGCGAEESATGMNLTFVAVTKLARANAGFASIIALDGLAPIGHLRWDVEDGEITFVLVDSFHRRRGVATALWAAALEVVAGEGWEPLRHSAGRSLEGDLWARSVGGDLPPLTSPALPYDELTTVEPVE